MDMVFSRRRENGVQRRLQDCHFEVGVLAVAATADSESAACPLATATGTSTTTATPGTGDATAMEPVTAAGGVGTIREPNARVLFVPARYVQRVPVRVTIQARHGLDHVGNRPTTQQGFDCYCCQRDRCGEERIVCAAAHAR